MSKVMVSLPADLLAEIDSEVRRRGTTRSALLATAVRRELAQPGSARVTEAVARSRRRFADSAAFKSADLVRADRDDRP